MIVLAAICRLITILNCTLHHKNSFFVVFTKRYMHNEITCLGIKKKSYTKFAVAHCVCVLNGSDRERKRGLL